MAGLLVTRPFERPLAEVLAGPPAEDFALYWLGQAGFVVELAGRRIVIDPYLSDSLAEKYRGTVRPHVRLMPAPLAAGDLTGVDAVLCTHAHTDHMDPATLKPLLAANPQARLVVPRAVLRQAVERSGRPEDGIIAVNAGETLQLLPDITIRPTRAAHEALETDADGNHRFLGYGLQAGAVSIWHSGDCVPFPGLAEEVMALSPAIALLPVNGRRPDLSRNGVPGNFSLTEAVALAREVGASDMIAHHYGLFDFNTEQPERIDAMAAACSGLQLLRARTGIAYGRALP